VTLWDLIMQRTFRKNDWSALGKGEVKDQETIDRMLMEGYEAIADES
jgi:hypothetical protein